MYILDSHIHLQGRPWIGHQAICFDATETVSELKKMKISGAIFTTWRSVLSESETDLDAGNAEALEVWEQHKDFLYPGLVMHPAFLKTSLKYLKLFRSLNLVWAGEWVPNYYGKNDCDAPEYAPLLRLVLKMA